MTGESKEISFFDLIAVARTSWLLILGFAFAFAAAAAAIAFNMTPVYRAEILLSPTPDSQQTSGSALSRLAQQFSGLSGMLDGLGGGNGVDKEVRLATLTSRHLTSIFIRDHNLLPELFAERLDSNGKWIVKDGKSTAPTEEEAFRRFDQKVRSVTEDRKTGLVSLAIEWPKPQLAADWANGLVAYTNEYLRERAIAEAQRSTTYLEAELQKTGVVERQQIIYRLIESKISDIMMANARPEFAFSIVDAAAKPDANHFVRPKRATMVLVGFFLGLLVGACWSLLRWARRNLRESVPGRQATPPA
ncbi:MAG TPA: Wzz/FepE/Etk N-terminal domain-containing protein [Povalibacter sp.]|nr:Wzz/FepE/Etk N-terminal domain-containing protein [Povalibacter sp.]